LLFAVVVGVMFDHGVKTQTPMKWKWSLVFLLLYLGLAKEFLPP
jgi:hypothetical protein